MNSPFSTQRHNAQDLNQSSGVGINDESLETRREALGSLFRAGLALLSFPAAASLVGCDSERSLPAIDAQTAQRLRDLQALYSKASGSTGGAKATIVASHIPDPSFG